MFVTAKSFEDAAWRPIHIEPSKPVAVFLMLLPKNGKCTFEGADWNALTMFSRPRYSEILATGIDDGFDRYDKLCKSKGGLVARVSAKSVYRYVADCLAKQEESTRILLATDLG